MPETNAPAEHIFTAHSNARLTFVIGVVAGISVMTLTGLGFFIYLFSGGEISSYAIAPIDTDSQILTEPLKSVTKGDQATIAEPAANQIFGATSDYEVTLVQYVDYECRFCKKFFPDVVDFANQHADSIRLIIKQYPLVQIHPNAKTASLAAYCAAQQDHLLEYSAKLYEQQEALGDEATYTAIATELGLDNASFSSCRAADSTVAAVEAEATEAVAAGIQTQPNLLMIHANGDRELIDGYVNASYLAGVLGY